MLINSIESLARDGYQIHVTITGEVYVYFSSESQERQGEVWNRDAELIRVFLAGRYVSGYFSLVAKEIRALSPSVASTSLPTTNADTKPATKPALKSVAEPVAEPVVDTSIPAAPAPFKPNLASCAEPPTQSSRFLDTFGNDEYVVYIKEDGNFHIHWKISREQAKGVWRRDRESIQDWLGADVLNTVSWEPLVDNGNSNAKWKEVSPETTKLSTVLRQVVSFGKRIADLAILEDGSHHVYFYLPRQEAKQIYPNIKGEFTGYEVTSVSFES